MDFNKDIPAGRGILALSPVGVFLIMYVVVSVVIGDFYKMPIAVALVVASVWAVLIYTGHRLVERIEVFSRAAGHANIMYMLWIFILAGAFASLAREIGAVEATVSLTLRFLPVGMLVPGIFIAACLISVSIGTSVGTVVALAPLAVEMAQAGGGNVAFYVAVVLGGAFFGDNLSFISDTTIAATRSQGVNMADKFRTNLKLALPAALVTLALYIFMGHNAREIIVEDSGHALMVIPYIVVIATAVAGINVTVVLSLGIISAMLLGLSEGYGFIEMFGFLGAGIDSMGNLIIITLLSAGMLGVIRAAGGINYLLQCLTKRVRGTRGAQGCIALLVSLVNLCTANNTVAIITTGSIAREIGHRYGVDPRKSASLLDTCSCIVQCLIPYGAQTLLATSLADISPAAPFPYLYYPWALAVMVVISVLVKSHRRFA